ncbi:oligosaccharide flippase family protein [Rubrivivax rivuli]|uniref:Lipopolysaccharide biosynthesis protein n=1 Tax=Rubrivivax rivuli TaxID=1862385 RepID=A0A437RSW4_9BURK|nr:oligosaccharide flippase family protein [Rubrivivax rivuli]RVU49831.1 hypothetical protein EOE66_04585 [Rubrivivax rivuli]
MSSLRGALAFSFIERWLSIIIALGSNMLLARLLTPQAIGIYSVSLAVLGIAQVLRDFGIVGFLIQEKKLTDAHLQTAFGLSLALGGLLFGVVFMGAPWVAQFYKSSDVATTLRICALSFLVLPFCTVSMALLRRNMHFKQVAAANLAGAGLGAVVSIGLAWLGLGVVSLAIGAVVGTATTGLASFILNAERRLLWPAFTAWRQMISYGAQSSLTGTVTSLSMDANDLAIGRVMGFEPVAVISKAQGLMGLFHKDVMGAIRNVMHPAFARTHREDGEMEPFYRLTLANVTAIAWPFYAFISLYALETMRLLFGQQWDQAAKLVPVYCLAGAIAALASLIGTLFLAMGRIDLTTRVELLFQPFRAALIVAGAVVFQSMEACAWALVLALALQVPLLYAYKGRCVPTQWLALGRQLQRSLLVCLLSIVVPAAIALTWGLDRAEPVPLGVFVAAIASCILSWPLALTACRHPLAADPTFLKVRRALLRF